MLFIIGAVMCVIFTSLLFDDDSGRSMPDACQDCGEDFFNCRCQPGSE